LKLTFLLLALLVCGVNTPTRQATLDKSQTEITNSVCVVDGIPLRFENSITVTQVIKQAGANEWGASTTPAEKIPEPKNQKL